MPELERLTRRDFLKVGLAAATIPSFFAACVKKAQERTLTFFNWSNYIGKKTIPAFEAESGIKIRTDLFSDEEEMFAKIKTGVQGYDVIVCTDYMIPRFKALDLLAPMPTDRLQNLDNLAPRFRHPPYDPDLKLTVPYLWGTTGIGYNKKFVPKPPDSWTALWDEKFAGKLSMLDNTRDAIGVALLMLGLPIDSKDPAQLRKAKDLLVKQRPLLKHYTSSTYMDELIAGELWLAQGWSGDVLQSARENPSVDYVFPKEGTFIYVDGVGITKGTPHMDEAVRFVDYLLRPEVAAEISNTVRYATPNGKAMPLMDAALAKDVRVFPSPEIEKRLRFYAMLDGDTENLWNQTWQEVKVA